MPMVTCSRCGEAKDTSEFYRDPSVSSKRRSECKECTAKERSTPEARAAQRVYMQEYRDRRRAAGTWPPKRVEGRGRGRPRST